MIDFRELRRKMIVLQNTVKKLNIQSRNMSLVLTNLELAMMWSGQYLKYSGLGDNPYAKLDGKRKNVLDIEPMFDNTQDYIKEVTESNSVEAIDKLRTFLEFEIKALAIYSSSSESVPENIANEDVVHTNLCLINIYKSISEAKMWLGMELGAMRDA